jgi:glycosyltransferase involved in cell wall biosynthesis
MKFVFASYVYTPEFNRPEEWINRIEFYVGIQEALSINHTVISIEQIDYEGEYLQNGVHFYFKRFTKKTGSYFQRELHQFIKSLNPDVVFIHGLHFSLQIIQLRLYLGRNINIIAQHHAEKPFTGIKKRVQQLADKCIDAYLFASYDMGMDWVNKGNLASPQKIHEVMEVSSSFYPVRKDIALTKTGITGTPVFLWVGRLDPQKDPLNVVKAFLQFSRVNTLARLYIIYQTEKLLPPIKELLDQETTYRDSIILVGKVLHPDLLYWFNSADFIISSSFYEGSGTAVCEAMSCGCVPVLTDIFSFRAMSDNGQNGILYEPGSQSALLSALMQTQQINVSEKRERTLAFFKSNLSFQAIAQRIEQIAASLAK